jgi:hypothetical protein
MTVIRQSFKIFHAEMFEPLPKKFALLEASVAKLGEAVIERPVDTRGIAERLLKTYDIAKKNNYANVPLSAYRKLPYAYFLASGEILKNLHPNLVTKYWDTFLPNQLKEQRRSKRWFAPLFFTYIREFSIESQSYLEFATKANRASELLSSSPYAKHIYSLKTKFDFFDPQAVGVKLGKVLIADGKDINQCLEQNFLWPEFLNSKLAKQSYLSALGLESTLYEGLSAVKRILEWSIDDLTKRHRYDNLHKELADAQLAHWKKKSAPDAVKKKLLNYFIEHYKNPQLIKDISNDRYWGKVSAVSREVINGWLTGETLRTFVKILEKTADDIWLYRQKFWMAYYDAGHVDEAWLVLGDQASVIARQLDLNQPTMAFGRLSGGATPNQSVLLIRIGSLIFSEWSHNGSLRAYHDVGTQAPSLYQRQYHGADLRARESLDFHRGQNALPQLTHAASSTGNWQMKARDFIQRETGIYMSNKAICL